jgi:hypothetical protein
MSHSRISPSSAHVWGALNGCPGSVRMTANYPDVEIPESTAGNVMHEIGAMMIGQFSRGIEPLPREYIGTTLSSGFLVGQEEYDAARMYAENVRDIMRQTHIFGGGTVGVEKPLPCPEIHQESYGTCDCFLFHRSAGHLWIWEFKSGRRCIEVVDNWQIINYLSGIISYFDLNGIDDQKIFVHARIVQPRGYHRDGPIREWTFKLSDIRGQINILRDNAALALSDNPPIRSGEQCRDCMARYECPAARTAGVTLYESVCTPAMPNNLSPESLSLLYSIVQRAKNQIDYLESGIGEQIKSLIRSGVNIPGYTTEETFGRLSWARPISEVFSLGELLGVNLKKEEAITPKQAEKLGVPEEIINQYAKMEKTGFKVVPHNLSKARRIFS